MGVRERAAIGSQVLDGLDVHGKAVLIHTGWSAHWRTDSYFEGHPFLTKEAAEHLQIAGARLVGIDSYNIDDIEDMTRPVHSTLLGDDIPIVEHMTGLDRLPDKGAVSSPFRSRSREWGRSRCGRLASWRGAERHGSHSGYSIQLTC